MKLTRKLVTRGVCSVIVITLSLTTLRTCAQSIRFKNNSPIDIILCTGDTNKDLQGFSEQLMGALALQNIDASRIRIMSSMREEVFTSKDGELQNMIDNFHTVIPDQTLPFISRQGNLLGPGVRDPSKPPPEGPPVLSPYPYNIDGLISNKEYPGNVNIEMTTQFYCPAHGMFFAPKLKYKDGKLSGYIVKLSVRGYAYDLEPPEPLGPGNTFTSGRPYAHVFWMEDVDPMDLRFMSNKLSIYNPNGGSIGGTPDTSHGTLRGVGATESFEYFLPPDNGDNVDDDSIGEDSGVPIFYTDPLSVGIQFTTTDLTILYEDKVVYTTKIPPERQISSGVMMYGLASADHGGLSEITYKVGSISPLIEAVRSPSYRPHSSRFIVDVCDNSREDFSNPEKVGELTQRMQADNTYYIGWGQSSSKSSIENFIRHNSDYGKFFQNTDSDIYQQTAEYIESIVNKVLTNEGTAYLTKDKQYIFTQNIS